MHIGVPALEPSLRAIFRSCSPHWPRLALPLGAGGRMTTVRVRTPNSDGARPSSSPKLSIRAGIWRCATPRAPCQLPSLTPPKRPLQTSEANSRLDKTWGQGQCFASESSQRLSYFKPLPVSKTSFWDRERFKIRESLARLVCDVMRLADGVASEDWLLSAV
jgi:hypothetical protein